MNTSWGDYTIGDEYEIECPHCHKTICIQDTTTDGCLRIGFRDQCPHCHDWYEFVEIEYSATVYVKPIGLTELGGYP